MNISSSLLCVSLLLANTSASVKAATSAILATSQSNSTGQYFGDIDGFLLLGEGFPYELAISSLVLLVWVALQAVLWTTSALKLESTKSKIE